MTLSSCQWNPGMLKIQSDLNKLSEWCDRNSLLLNVGKCKTITFARSRRPVEFSYMLGGTIARSGELHKQSRSHHGRENYFFGACKRHGCNGLCDSRIYQRLSLEFRDPYTLKSLYTSLVRPKLEYASCVGNPFYDVRVERVKRVQRRFIRYALRCLGWMDMHDLPPCEDRCNLLHLDTLTKRRSIACVMFNFNVLSGRVNSPSLLTVLAVPSFCILIAIKRTMEFMNQCRVRCDSLMRSLVFLISV
jgi:hypothetical protein